MNSASQRLKVGPQEFFSFWDDGLELRAGFGLESTGAELEFRKQSKV